MLQPMRVQYALQRPVVRLSPPRCEMDRIRGDTESICHLCSRSVNGASHSATNGMGRGGIAKGLVEEGQHRRADFGPNRRRRVVIEIDQDSVLFEANVKTDRSDHGDALQNVCMMLKHRAVDVGKGLWFFGTLQTFVPPQNEG